jgi:LysM repeat protein
LTSIAKHYNIALPDLLKANKGIDERKLQIGQTINLPPNTQTKTPEPAEKGQP